MQTTSAGTDAGWRRSVVAIVVVTAMLVAIGLFESMNMWCDGAYQRFQVPDDYRGGGCSRIIPSWHGIFPWNWDETEMGLSRHVHRHPPMWTPDD